VDGTDFRINEPTPFSSSWFSHKFNGPAVRYEVAICIQTGWIVHVNGPFAAGRWSDINIARHLLCYLLGPGDEMAVADGGYQDGYEFFETPTGEHNADQKMKSDARARHECVNGMFKTWKILKARYIGPLERHGDVFKCIANLTQLDLETYPERIWQLEYYDRDAE